MSQLASDNFNRADGGLGSSWTTVPSSSNPAIVSQVVQTGAVGTDGAAIYNGVTWPNDQYAQVTAITSNNGNDGALALVRGSTSVQTFYRGGISGSAFGGSAGWKITKAVSGTFTDIASGTTAIAANDLLYLEAQGTTVLFKVNGSTIGSQTDSAIASGNAGLAVFVDGGAAGDAQVDSWLGGDFSGGGAPTFSGLGMLAAMGT